VVAKGKIPASNRIPSRITRSKSLYLLIHPGYSVSNDSRYYNITNRLYNPTPRTRTSSAATKVLLVLTC